jgi:hypothetical protein
VISWRTLSAVKKIGVSSCAACGHYGEVGMIAIDPGAALDWALEVCCQLTRTKQASTQQAQPVPWCSPEVGTLKINIDGSFLQNSHTGATGALMRDSNGVLQAASARCLDSVGSALQAEA